MRGLIRQLPTCVKFGKRITLKLLHIPRIKRNKEDEIINNHVFLGSPSAFGGTKEAEYHRTIEMLVGMTGKSRQEIMHILYFLHDSQYGNQDLKEMAELILREKRSRTHDS